MVLQGVSISSERVEIETASIESSLEQEKSLKATSHFRLFCLA